MSSRASGRTDVRQRSVLTRTGKKQSTPAMATFDHGLSVPNQAFVIGAKAMIGIALAAIRYGISALPSERHRASTSAKTNAVEQPIANPPSASLKVIQPPRHRVSRSFQ